MRKIGQLLENKKTSAGQAKKRKEWDAKGIFFAFERVIREEYGSQGAAHLQPDFWKEGKLFVRGVGAAWASELQLRREEVRRKLNAELGQEEVQEIKLKK